MPQIEAKNLRKVYHEADNGTAAVDGISLTIDKGEFVAIMGPSGSGKSTLLHILGLLDAPTSGEYRFEGARFEDLKPDEIARIRNEKMGFVFQAFNLLPRFTALENVKLPLLYSRIPEIEWEPRAKEALVSVGLGERMHHRPTELSGGEKQRVAIARALVMHPNIIFADEPTGNLDSKSGQTVMNVLQELNRERSHTIILITHETYTAEHAGRIIRLMDGKIVSDETVKARRDARNHFSK